MEKLSLKEKLSYAAGDIANGLAVSSCAFWYLIYLTDVVRISPALAGVALMAGRIWDALINPVVGVISDNTSTRWGRRRPFLLFGSFAFGFCFIFLWGIPEFSSQATTFIYLLFLLIIFNSIFTIVFVPYASLTAAMTSDYNERTSLTAYRLTFSQISFLLGATLPSIIVSWAKSDKGQLFLINSGLNTFFASWAGTEKQSYLLMALIFSVVMIISILICFAGTEEKIQEKNQDKQKAAFSLLAPVVTTLKEIKLNYPFRKLVTITLLTNIVATFVGINIPYWLQYVLNIKDQGHFVIGTLFLSAIISIPIWAVFSKRFGKAETYGVAMLIYALLLFALPLITAESKVVIYSFSAFAGIFYAAGLMLPWAMVPDLVEYDQVSSGKRREGLFYGGNVFVYKFASAISVLISALFLDLLGYIPDTAQSATVIGGIRIIMGPLPALILIFAYFVSKKYPITNQKHKEILSQLEKQNV